MTWVLGLILLSYVLEIANEDDCKWMLAVGNQLVSIRFSTYSILVPSVDELAADRNQVLDGRTRL